MNRARTCNALRGVAYCALLALAQPASAAGEATGDYAVEWFTIDAGGGASSGGAYAVEGTLGQPDAEPLHPADGGAFALTGGFWALPTGEVPSAPLLVDSFESP